MNEDNTGNIIWNMLGFTIERLNICDNAPVHNLYMKQMEYIGTFGFTSVINGLFTDDDSSSINWYLNMNDIRHMGQIHLYKTDVFHKLRFSHKSGGHNECWIFGLIPCKDNFWRLCPLKRNSDFDYDIFEHLENMRKSA
jgi:hypothetical protein